MPTYPAGFESDFSDDEELIQFSKTIASTKKAAPEIIPNVVEHKPPQEEKIVEKPKINWNNIGVKNSLIGDGYYLDELKPIEQKSLGVVNLFEENLKRLLLAEDIKGMDFLIEDDFDLNFCFANRLSLVSFLAYHHKKNMISYFLEKGVNTSIPDSISPIIALCSRKCASKSQALNSLTILELLIKFKIDVNSLSKEGQNCLHYCINNENVHLFAEILKHDVNIHVEDRANITPLCLAARKGEKVIVDLLLSRFSHSQSDINEIRRAIKLCSNFSIETMLQHFIDNPDMVYEVPASIEMNESNFEDQNKCTNQNDALCNLLNGVGMKHLVSQFTKKSINFNDVIKMTPEFLSNRMQLSDEEVTRLKNIINEIILNSYDKNSLFLGNKNSFSIIDVSISLHNIVDRINFLNSSCRNLFEQIQIINVSQCSTLKEAFDDSCAQLLTATCKLTETANDLISLNKTALKKREKARKIDNSTGNYFLIKSISLVGLAIGCIVLVVKKASMGV